MSKATLRCFALLALLVTINAADCDAEQDEMTMLQKDQSLVKNDMKAASEATSATIPPAPDARGLSDWDKNYITDKQSGPFYDERTLPHTDAVPMSPSNQRTVTFALTLFLIIMVVLLVSIICLLSAGIAHSAGIHKMSCGIVSQAISIFCAFLVFNAMKDLLRWSAIDQLRNSLVLLALIVFLSHLQLFLLRRWPLALVGTGMVASYTIALAAINVFEVVQRFDIFIGTDFAGRASLSIMAFILIALFIIVSTSIREMLESALKSNERCRGLLRFCCCCADVETMVSNGAWAEWKKRAGKSEDQMAAVVIGFLLSQAVEYGILLASPTPVGVPVPASSYNFQTLALATGFFAAAGVCIGFVVSSGFCNRVTLLTLNSSLMASTWCLFHSAQWQYEKGKLGDGLGLQAFSFQESLLVALSTSLVTWTVYALVCCYSLYFHTAPWSEAQLSTFQALAAGLGFALAMPWVTSFTIAILEASKAWTKHAVMVTGPAAVIVCVLALPVWGMYVLPRTSIGKPVEGQ